jgi:hypothetical protein
MNHGPSNNKRSGSQGPQQSSPATTEGFVRALDDLLARFPKPESSAADVFDLSLPPAPKEGVVTGDDVQARLDALALRISAATHDAEASGRENQFLRGLVNDLLQNKKGPDGSEPEQK